MASQPDAQLVAQYTSRAVTYPRGDLDTCNSARASRDDRSLDRRCEAMLQGANQLERGPRFCAHMNAYFAGHSRARQLVRGVGHEGRRMLNSPAARGVLFR